MRPDDSIARVVVANADGYAEVTAEALRVNPTLQLQPWGSLEVTGLQGDSAFRFGTDSLLRVGATRFENAAGSNRTVRVFSKLPPGNHDLIQYPTEAETPFEIRPGEVTRLDLPATMAGEP